MYIRSIFSALVFMFATTVAHAQPVIDIGQDDTLAEAAKPEKKEEARVIEQAKDSRGMFSFMNFSFFKKDEPAEIKTATEGGGLEQLIKDADAGKTEAQITLGYLYLYGNNMVQADQQKAFHYYALAAQQGDMIAINNLGSLYYSGIGTPRNPAKAAEMFEKAVELGNNDAAVNLAFIYLTGMGMPKDYAKSMKLFQTAANEGNATAQFMLGYAYYKGFGVKRDVRQAFDLMNSAAKNKYDDAQYVLAKMYVNGDGVAKDYGMALQYLIAAAQQGNVSAMVDLGGVLATGSIAKKNFPEAHIWFNVASVYGDPAAPEKRDMLEKGMQLDEILNAQAVAGKFKERPSDVTVYIRQTFGENIKGYIDEALASSRVTK